MVGNLPAKHICWRIVQDHEAKNLFFLATEFGVFASVNAGEKWFKLGGGAPTISFRDLEIQTRENDLVAASFGRSFYVLDDYTLLRHATVDTLKEDLHLFPVRRAFWYVPNNDLGGRKGYQGDSLYTAENPDYGAVVRYHVKDSWKSAKAKRKEAEAKIRAKGGDVPTPTFDELQAEEDEIAPRNYLDITDSSGTTVARLNLSTSKGLHKIVWNMRFQGLAGRGGGPLVAPGKYTAQAFRDEGGQAVAIGNATEIELESIVEPTLQLPDRKKLLKSIESMGLFVNRAQSLGQDLSEALEDLESLIPRIKSHPNGTSELLAQAQKLKQKLEEFDRDLSGNELKSDRWTMTRPGVRSRLSRAMFSSMGGTHGPTKASLEQFEIGRKQFESIEPQLKRLLNRDFKQFEKALESAKVPRLDIELESGEGED